MRKDEHKKTGKAVPPGDTAPPPSNKPLLVRKLTTLEDVRRIQARLVKEFLAGRISTETAKTGAYLTATLTATLRELKPPQGQGEVITLVEVVGGSEEEEAFIKAMNSNILPAPTDNTN